MRQNVTNVKVIAKSAHHTERLAALLTMGNNEKIRIAMNICKNTLWVDSKREDSSTEAEMAALTDNVSENLNEKMYTSERYSIRNRG